MDTEISIGAAPGLTLRSERSCPAQKPRPAPVRSTARTSASSSARFTAARSSSCIPGLKAFSFSGRFSVTLSTPASRATRIEGIGTAYNSGLPKVYSIDGITPVVHPSAYVHPSAVLIGDVIVGAGCYIGPFASLRGDFGGIRVHAGANIQDSCIMHGFPGTDTTVEENGHIGHAAVLHSCAIGKNAL